MDHMAFGERLKELGQFLLEKKKARGDFSALCNYPLGEYKDRDNFVSG